jgi:hypothetical protein
MQKYFCQTQFRDHNLGVFIHFPESDVYTLPPSRQFKQIYIQLMLVYLIQQKKFPYWIVAVRNNNNSAVC